MLHIFSKQEKSKLPLLVEMYPQLLEDMEESDDIDRRKE